MHVTLPQSNSSLFKCQRISRNWGGGAGDRSLAFLFPARVADCLLPWQPSSSAFFSESSRYPDFTLCCLLIRSTFALCFEGDSHKESNEGEGVLDRLQHPHFPFSERQTHVLRCACGWQFHFQSVTADWPEGFNLHDLQLW